MGWRLGDVGKGLWGEAVSTGERCLEERKNELKMDRKKGREPGTVNALRATRAAL